MTSSDNPLDFHSEILSVLRIQVLNDPRQCDLCLQNKMNQMLLAVLVHFQQANALIYLK